MVALINSHPPLVKSTADAVLPGLRCHHPQRFPLGTPEKHLCMLLPPLSTPATVWGRVMGQHTIPPPPS
eukprot:2897992-Karenia_brevis.AAC.1